MLEFISMETLVKESGFIESLFVEKHLVLKRFLGMGNSLWKGSDFVLVGEFCFCGIYRVLSLCLGTLWSKVEYLV